MRARIVMIVIVAAATPARADHWYDDHRRVAHVAVTAAVGLAYVASETVLKSHLASSTCRWCKTDGFDVDVRNALVWHDTIRATSLSNFSGYLLAPGFALAFTVAGSVTRDGSIPGVIDDVLPVVDSVLAAEVLVQTTKFAVARQRPGVHFDPPGPPQLEDNVSFFSAHSASTFAFATGAAMVARHHHSWAEPYLWTIGYALAATTAYLRIAADKHYFTDVITGTAVGIGTGLAIPVLEERAELVPNGTGVTVVGQF